MTKIDMPRRVKQPRRSLPSYDKLQRRIAQLEEENAALTHATRFLTKQNNEQLDRLNDMTLKVKKYNRQLEIADYYMSFTTIYGKIHRIL